MTNELKTNKISAAAGKTQCLLHLCVSGSLCVLTGDACGVHWNVSNPPRPAR